MVKAGNILLVEDTVPLAETYLAYLKNDPYSVHHEATGTGALAALDRLHPEVVLLDLVLPDMNGIEILKHISAQQIETAVVVITANASLNVAVEAMRLGAVDFLVKPFNADRLRVTIRNVLERQQLTKIVETYRNEIDRREYGGFIGASIAMQRVYRIIESAAGSKATVFITGESGTGKEVCAEAIHQHSPRASKPFVAINCGAIPKDLLESEIFGHVKGAFTGAVAAREGAAARANGGTLFLDEICELDLNLQTKLLRFIQTGTFQPVGSSKTEQVDIRIVCATNREPMVEVAEGRFREDLFYRLHVIPIVLPPLRDREDDFIAIAQSFLETCAAEEGKSFAGFSDEARGIFAAYPWPGNVRQLQNVVRNIVVLNDGDEVTADMMPAPLDQYVGKALPVPADVGRALGRVTPGGPRRGPDRPETGSPQGDGFPSLPRLETDIRPLDEVEREVIEAAIRACEGNVPKAATRLGISPSTIYRKRQSWEEKFGRAAAGG